MEKHVPGQKSTPNLLDRCLGQFLVLALLGKGGMGDVYLAEDQRLRRRVALKVLHPDLTLEPRHLERFRREARAIAALNHPSIVTLHSVEEAEGLHFLVLELVEGKTLSDLLAAGRPMPLDQVLGLAIPLAEALEAAHARGIVHRDLKPRNIMVSHDGRVKILDFGIARLIRMEAESEEVSSDDTGLTRTGDIIGTAAYMSPEQIQEGSVDHRSDLFSLGIVLYEMAAGQRPFGGRGRLTTMAAILYDSPQPPSALVPELPDRFDGIVSMCLAKEPYLRYRGAAELRKDLLDLASGGDTALASTALSGFAERPPASEESSSSTARGKTNPRLPARPRCFGREAEVREIAEALCGDPPPPVPVLGPAGAGKSTITLAALYDRHVAERFGQRRWFVRCDGATGRDSLVGAIARAVCPEAVPPLEPKILAKLEGSPAALALDNFETPWERDTAAVEELLTELSALSGLALIVALRGEQRPFGPSWREAIHAGPLDPESARSTFLAVAGERYASDPDLEPLLLDLDGLALAVVLLASQAEGEPDLSMLRLVWQTRRTELLRRAGASGPQQSLEVSLGLSIDSPRMTGESRRLLSILGLLPDGAARDDLEALFPGHGAEAASVLRKVGLVFDQGSRLRMLAPIREYVRQRHPPPGEDLDRTVDHYLALARIGEKIGTEAGAEAAARLRSEMGNLEPMILTAFERADPIPAIHSTLAYAEAVRATGVGGLALIGRARQAAQAAAQTKLEADCVRKFGDINIYRGNLAQSWSFYEEAREIYRKTRDLHGEACCTACLGDVYLQQAQPMAASRLYEEAWNRFHELGDLYWEAYCLHGLGHTAAHRSEKGARLLLEKAIALFRQIDDVRGEANCLMNMGHSSVYLNDLETARTEYAAALPLFRRIGSLVGESSCLRSLGHIALQQGNPKAARALTEKALLLSRRVGSTLGEANCLFILGETARANSEHQRAEALLQEALPRFQQVGQAVGMANCLESLGLNAAAQSDPAKARPLLEEALRLNQQVPRPAWVGRCHLHMAKLEPPGSLKRRQHIDAARQAWDEAGILGQMRHELEAVAAE